MCAKSCVQYAEEMRNCWKLIEYCMKRRWRKKAGSAYMIKDTASEIVESWWNIIWKEDWERKQTQLIWLRTQLSHDAEQLWLTKLCHSWILASVCKISVNAKLLNTALSSKQFMSDSFICMHNAAHSSMIKLLNTAFSS